MTRQASSRASGPSAIGLTPRCALPPLQALQEQQRLGMNPRPGGLPEWVEMWGVDSFRKTGYVLAGISAASVPLALGGHIAELPPVTLPRTITTQRDALRVANALWGPVRCPQCGRAGTATTEDCPECRPGSSKVSRKRKT